MRNATRINRDLLWWVFAVDAAVIAGQHARMVGTLTPGTTANPSGQTYHPQQEQRPVASVRGGATYNLSGTRNLDEMTRPGESGD